MDMRTIINLVEVEEIPLDTIIDLRDPAHQALVDQFEYSWGFNPVDAGKPFGVIGAKGRVTKVFSSQKTASVYVGRERTRAAMARSTKPEN